MLFYTLYEIIHENFLVIYYNSIITFTFFKSCMQHCNNREIMIMEESLSNFKTIFGFLGNETIMDKKIKDIIILNPISN